MIVAIHKGALFLIQFLHSGVWRTLINYILWMSFKRDNLPELQTNFIQIRPHFNDWRWFEKTIWGAQSGSAFSKRQKFDPVVSTGVKKPKHIRFDSLELWRIQGSVNTTSNRKDIGSDLREAGGAANQSGKRTRVIFKQIKVNASPLTKNKPFRIVSIF